MLPKKLQKKLEERIRNNALRQLSTTRSLTDFSSNDYLGFNTSEAIALRANQILAALPETRNGSGGSRLLTGNHQLYMEAENLISSFHNTEAAIIFNSGYDANIGLLSSVAQRGDLILYDELVHASIRDGITMSNAKAYKFHHNDLSHLNDMVAANSSIDGDIYIVTESVFSMDGDSPDLAGLSQYCNENGYHLIVDEAHAIGVLGNGKGLICELGIENEVFAAVITFGKALGVHGAAVLGGTSLKQFLINFSRSFIYTTGLPPHSVAAITAAYEQLLEQKKSSHGLQRLHHNIALLRLYVDKYNVLDRFIESNSAIHCCLVSGNNEVKSLARKLQQDGFDIRPILAPTVPEGQERLRICLHSYNSEKEIKKLVSLISKYLSL